MKFLLLRLLLAIALLCPGAALARGHGGGGHHSSSGGRSSGGSHGGFRSSSHGFYSGGGHYGGGHHARGSHHGSGTAHAGHNRNAASQGVARDSHGRIKRSQSAKNEFKRSHPCPATGKSGGACPGYVIDHVKALKHGGADSPSNMQWQTRAAAKEKDRWE